MTFDEIMENDVKISVPQVSHEDAVFIAMEMGENMLRCGGEVSRAEDTVNRICMAYGAVTVDVTAILSVIVLTVDFGDVSVNSSRRETSGPSATVESRRRSWSAVRMVGVPPPT